MKERNHINAPFVITAVQQKETWIDISIQFMMEKKHINAQFVTTAFQEKIN